MGSTQAIAQSFSSASHQYDDHAILQQMVNKKISQRWHEMLIDAGQLLDLGCGTGLLSANLKSKPCDHLTITGVDIAYGMLQKARSHQRIDQCLIASAMHLPFANDTFDQVASNLMLQWCTDIDCVLSSIYNVLKPNKLLLATTLLQGSLHELDVSWRAALQPSPILDFIDMTTLGDALKRVGFTSIAVMQETIVFRHPQVQDIIDHLRSIGAHARQRSRSGIMTPRQLECCYQAYKDNFSHHEGGVLCTYRVGYIMAKKPEAKTRFSANETGSFPADQLKRSSR